MNRITQGDITGLVNILEELNIGHADGSYRQQLAKLAKKKLLILNDWGMDKLSAKQARTLTPNGCQSISESQLFVQMRNNIFQVSSIRN
ncbi:ATP-binding protein [Alteromonas sp. 14N.309.X.WAT.G.H12]|uniref:ATP-binding protein n=1 Tax=Alteromonas sp. 14N.309.X.WAT.G.H12 TaxID=3120824 RepID=UPI003A599348